MKIRDIIFWIFVFTLIIIGLYFLFIDGISLFDGFILEMFLILFLFIKLFELENKIITKNFARKYNKK